MQYDAAYRNKPVDYNETTRQTTTRPRGLAGLQGALSLRWVAVGWSAKFLGNSLGTVSHSWNQGSAWNQGSLGTLHPLKARICSSQILWGAAGASQGALGAHKAPLKQQHSGIVLVPSGIRRWIVARSRFRARKATLRETAAGLPPLFIQELSGNICYLNLSIMLIQLSTYWVQNPDIPQTADGLPLRGLRKTSEPASLTADLYFDIEITQLTKDKRACKILRMSASTSKSTSATFCKLLSFNVELHSAILCKLSCLSTLK